MKRTPGPRKRLLQSSELRAAGQLQRAEASQPSIEIRKAMRRNFGTGRPFNKFEWLVVVVRCVPGSASSPVQWRDRSRRSSCVSPCLSLGSNPHDAIHRRCPGLLHLSQVHQVPLLLLLLLRGVPHELDRKCSIFLLHIDDDGHDSGWLASKHSNACLSHSSSRHLGLEIETVFGWEHETGVGLGC